jgi:hypothetical protein
MMAVIIVTDCQFLVITIIIIIIIIIIIMYLTYFPKMKVGLSNHKSVSLSPTNNF